LTASQIKKSKKGMLTAKQRIAKTLGLKFWSETLWNTLRLVETCLDSWRLVKTREDSWRLVKTCETKNCKNFGTQIWICCVWTNDL
jgi:hypothetical protein